jgi:uncharacterized protein (DUF2147 family)
MNRTFFLLLPLLAGMALPATASARDPVEGVWRNRPNTLVVSIAPCGTALCGTIIQADDEAKASTRKAGTSHLIGTRVLIGLRKSSAGTYSGQVFNPNLNIHAAGTVTLVSPAVLLVKGCVLGGLICKQQHWNRVS